MSRAIHRRLLVLEHRAAPPVSHLVLLNHWPETEAEWEVARAAHPEGRFFVPPTLTEEQWDSTVPEYMARLKAGEVQAEFLRTWKPIP